MKKIKEIRIKNFKAFPDEQVFKLNGKNLLLFGENGAGKSSLYWALYTFLQSSEKISTDVDKYFEDYDHTDDKTYQSLLNIHSPHSSTDAYIDIIFDDGSNTNLSKGNANNTNISHIKEANLASDFLTYKFLYNFYANTHKNDLDVWDVFRKDILPYFTYGTMNYDEHYSNFHTNKAKDSYTGYYYRRNSHEYKSYQSGISLFNANLDGLLGQINNQANDFLSSYLGINNLKIILSYTKKFAWDVGNSRAFTKPRIKLHVEILKEGAFTELHRPQSFLNEAVLAQISLSIRMGALFTRLAQSETKILVLDDLLISLDMDNRDKVIDFILQRKTKTGDANKFDEFQILFLTHDRALNEFVDLKITQHKRRDGWLFQSIHQGTYAVRGQRNYPKPIVIDEYLDDLERAKSYLRTKKDYTSAALYVRKALEKTISDHLPQELVYSIKGEQRGLAMLWEEFCKCYTIPQDKITLLSQSRSMILNPQAHYNFMSLPVYHAELMKAVKLVEYIQNNVTPIKPTILLSKGMILEFVHPSSNYTFEFELLADLYMTTIVGHKRLNSPKCKVVSWQFDATSFWNFVSNNVFSQQQINKIKNREDKFEKVINNLTLIKQLGIDVAMIKDNTTIKNSIWTLKDVLDKAGVGL